MKYIVEIRKENKDTKYIGKDAGDFVITRNKMDAYIFTDYKLADRKAFWNDGVVVEVK